LVLKFSETNFVIKPGYFSRFSELNTDSAIGFFFQHKHESFSVPKHPEQNCSLSSLVLYLISAELKQPELDAKYISLPSSKVNACCYRSFHPNTFTVMFLDQINRAVSCNAYFI